MARGYEVAIGADGRAFNQAVQRDIIKPVDEAARSLDELGAAGDDAGREASRGLDKLDDSLKDVERTADNTGTDSARSLGKLEAALKDAQAQSKKTEKAVDDVGDGGRRGFGRATDASKEFKDEAVSNVSEIASSFDGSMESIGELAQGTLGGLAGSTIPGIGIAATAAAASIGVITENWTKVTEATDEARDTAYDYGITVAASGEFAAANQRFQELTGSVEGLKNVQDIATATGWEQKDVLTALATGDGLPALSKAFDDNSLSTNIAMGRLAELNGILDGTAQGLDLAKDGVDLQASSLYDLAMRTGTATGKFVELGKQIYAMPDGTEIVVDARTKKATEDLEDVERKVEGIKDKEVRVKYVPDTSAVDRYQPPAKEGSVYYGTGRQRI